MEVLEFYAETSWGSMFGSTHRGMDIVHGPGTDVPKLFPGTVVVRSRNADLGGLRVVDRGVGIKGRYIGYGHVIGGSGEDLGVLADWGEDHGDKWSGPHLHLTVSDYIDGLYNPKRANYDPLPFVIQAITQLAGSGSTPITTQSIYMEEETMKLIAHVKTDNSVEEIALVSPEFENGFIVAKGGTALAAALLRTYSPRLDGTPHLRVFRADYVAAIEGARVVRAAYLKGKANNT